MGWISVSPHFASLLHLCPFIPWAFCSLCVCCCLYASCLSKFSIWFAVSLWCIQTCDMNQITTLPFMWLSEIFPSSPTSSETFFNSTIQHVFLMNLPHVLFSLSIGWLVKNQAYLDLFTASFIPCYFLFFRNKKKTKVQPVGQNTTLISSIQWQL